MSQWVNTVNMAYLHTLSKYRSGRDISAAGDRCNDAPVTQMQERKGKPARTPRPAVPRLPQPSEPLNMIPQTSYITTLSDVLCKGKLASMRGDQLTLECDQTDKRLHFLIIATTPRVK